MGFCATGAIQSSFSAVALSAAAVPADDSSFSFNNIF